MSVARLKPTPHFDTAILVRFRAGFDTYAIAKALGQPEWFVANRLAQLIEKEKQTKGRQAA